MEQEKRFNGSRKSASSSPEMLSSGRPVTKSNSTQPDRALARQSLNLSPSATVFTVSHRGPPCCENCSPTTHSICDDCYSSILNSKKFPRFFSSVSLHRCVCLFPTGEIGYQSELTPRGAVLLSGGVSVQFSKLITENEEGKREALRRKIYKL